MWATRWRVVHKSTGRMSDQQLKTRNQEMGIEIESLFTSALGLSAPWRVEKVNLDTASRRIDFDLTCDAKRLACPACGFADQGIHDRQKRQWRHLDFFQYEAWLHAQVPRIACSGCGKTTQMPVPWAREGSGFTALFEALLLGRLGAHQKWAVVGYPDASLFVDASAIASGAGRGRDGPCGCPDSAWRLRAGRKFGLGANKRRCNSADHGRSGCK